MVPCFWHLFGAFRSMGYTHSKMLCANNSPLISSFCIVLWEISSWKIEEDRRRSWREDSIFSKSHTSAAEKQLSSFWVMDNFINLDSGSPNLGKNGSRIDRMSSYLLLVKSGDGKMLCFIKLCFVGGTLI